ncbi:MAG: CAP domain-containing protein [Gemmatimonadota bacterium]
MSCLLLPSCQRVALVPTGRPAAPVTQPRDEPVAIRNFAELVNQHRKKIGCPALSWDDQIAAVAQAHSDDMVRNNFFAHKNPRGQDAFDRLTIARIRYSAAAENIAYGQPTPGEVLTGWLNSPGHRRNIDNCRYTRHGVGLAGTRWTHVFVGG